MKPCFYLDDVRLRNILQGTHEGRAREKFKINVTSHLKIIIFIIKDLQISKCDIIFKNGRFSAFEG